jgi:cytochrome P450
LDLDKLPRMAWDWVANEAMDPSALMDELRELTWVAASDRGLEVFRYEDVSRLLRDRNMQKQPHRIMDRLTEMGITEGPVREYHERSILTQDGDPHVRLRLPLASFFAPRRAENLRDAARSIVERALNRVADRPTIDVLNDLCESIPSEMFCHLISAPPELGPQVARLSDSMLGPLIERGTDRTAEHEAAYYELISLLEELVAERRRTPGDDVLSDLIEINRVGRLTEHELLDQAAMLLEASIDNTAHQLTWALGYVLCEQDRWAMVKVGAQSPVPIAEEILRLASIGGAILRFPVEAFEYHDLIIPAGQPIFVNLRSANRDPRMFDDPTAFRTDRPSRPGPITFGVGPHTCLGQHLARIELQELIAQFTAAFPDAELAKPPVMSYGPIASRVRHCAIRLNVA